MAIERDGCPTVRCRPPPTQLFAAQQLEQLAGINKSVQLQEQLRAVLGERLTTSPAGVCAGPVNAPSFAACLWCRRQLTLDTACSAWELAARPLQCSRRMGRTNRTTGTSRRRCGGHDPAACSWQRKCGSRAKQLGRQARKWLAHFALAQELWFTAPPLATPSSPSPTSSPCRRWPSRRRQRMWRLWCARAPRTARL